MAPHDDHDSEIVLSQSPFSIDQERLLSKLQATLSNDSLLFIRELHSAAFIEGATEVDYRFSRSEWYFASNIGDKIELDFCLSYQNYILNDKVRSGLERLATAIHLVLAFQPSECIVLIQQPTKQYAYDFVSKKEVHSVPLEPTQSFSLTVRFSFLQKLKDWLRSNNLLTKNFDLTNIPPLIQELAHTTRLKTSLNRNKIDQESTYPLEAIILEPNQQNIPQPLQKEPCFFFSGLKAHLVVTSSPEEQPQGWLLDQGAIIEQQDLPINLVGSHRHYIFHITTTDNHRDLSRSKASSGLSLTQRLQQPINWKLLVFSAQFNQSSPRQQQALFEAHSRILNSSFNDPLIHERVGLWVLTNLQSRQRAHSLDNQEDEISSAARPLTGAEVLQQSYLNNKPVLVDDQQQAQSLLPPHGSYLPDGRPCYSLAFTTSEFPRLAEEWGVLLSKLTLSDELQQFWKNCNGLPKAIKTPRDEPKLVWSWKPQKGPGTLSYSVSDRVLWNNKHIAWVPFGYHLQVNSDFLCLYPNPYCRYSLEPNRSSQQLKERSLQQILDQDSLHNKWEKIYYRYLAQPEQEFVVRASPKEEYTVYAEQYHYIQSKKVYLSQPDPLSFGFSRTPLHEIALISETSLDSKHRNLIPSRFPWNPPDSQVQKIMEQLRRKPDHTSESVHLYCITQEESLLLPQLSSSRVLWCYDNIPIHYSNELPDLKKDYKGIIALLQPPLNSQELEHILLDSLFAPTTHPATQINSWLKISSPIVEPALNLTFKGRQKATVYASFTIIAPENEGCFGQLYMTSPEGTEHNLIIRTPHGHTTIDKTQSLGITGVINQPLTLEAQGEKVWSTGIPLSFWNTWTQEILQQIVKKTWYPKHHKDFLQFLAQAAETHRQQGYLSPTDEKLLQQLSCSLPSASPWPLLKEQHIISPSEPLKATKQKTLESSELNDEQKLRAALLEHLYRIQPLGNAIVPISSQLKKVHFTREVTPEMLTLNEQGQWSLNLNHPLVTHGSPLRTALILSHCFSVWSHDNPKYNTTHRTHYLLSLLRTIP